ncbi:MAG TPA: site-specific integrase [Flavisolibacter sp.]
MLPEVVLRPLYHRAAEQIALVFRDPLLRARITKVPGVKWSRTHGIWYVPLTRDSYSEVRNALGSYARVDTSELKQYLDQRRVQLSVNQGKKVSRVFHGIIQKFPLAEGNLRAYDRFEAMLRLMGYSRNTIRVYCNEFHLLLRLLKKVCVDDLRKEHLMSYLLWLMQKRNYSEIHIHTTVNALKFYFEKVLGRDREFYELPRPKKRETLPPVLSEQELVRMLNQVENLKHRCLLMTAYGAGLRVSELVQLRVGDIDSERMLIHVRLGKGKKDRMVPLSVKLLEVLRVYYRLYRPKEYLFEGAGGGPYSVRSAQIVLAGAKKRAGITKKGGIHSLRHSYATHLLEAGTDIRYIQAFLGHQSLATTMIYTHVSQVKIGSFTSPLDRLDL